MKKCGKCKIEKPLEEFSKDKSRKDGRCSYCKICDSEKGLKYRELHKHEGQVYQKEWYQKNKKIKVKQDKALSNKNKQRIIIVLPEFKYCPSCYKEKLSKEFYRNSCKTNGLSTYCKDCSYERAKKRVSKEREYRRKNAYKRRAREKERLRTDIQFNLTRKLRGRLRDALKNNRKSAKTLELVGCTVQELRVYLETLFTDGMSWEFVLSGEIHIDHIRPCASFDLSDPEQQKECFHYTNLQPLWAKDNLRKGDKWNNC